MASMMFSRLCAGAFVLFTLLSGPCVAFGQTPQTPSGSPGFTVAPPPDEISGRRGNGVGQRGQASHVDSPERTVGPQTDGSIVVSDNQVLTPAGRLIELGSPVRAKAIALNPNVAAHSAAVLLMDRRSRLLSSTR